LSGRGGCLKKILGKALQYAAGIEYRYFFLGIQAAGHRDFNTLAVATIDPQRQGAARSDIA
jgi:hypothetical protein